MELDESPPKRLRSAETDLRVIVGGTNGNRKKEYHYHSVILAAQSKYIDSMLASPMKEGAEYVIRFPDINPETWETMMKFLDSLESLQMTLAAARELVVLYDKYDFLVGRACCDLVIARLFNNLFTSTGHLKKPDNLEALVDVYALSGDIHLPTTREAGKKYFSKSLEDMGQYGRIIFKEAHLKKLSSLIIQDKLLTSWTEEEVSQSTFSKQFVENAIDMDCRVQLKRIVSEIELKGTHCKADGPFEREEFLDCHFACDRHVRWDGQMYEVYIGMLEDEWVIYGSTFEPVEDGEGREVYQSRIFWKCPYSRNRIILPPKSGWVPVDALARGEPKIEYIYRERTS